MTNAMKFRADSPGVVQAIRVYKSVADTGTHIGKLWDSSHTLLASVTFTGETASGWQEQALGTPVRLTPNQTYFVTHYSPTGNVAYTLNFLPGDDTNGYVKGHLAMRPNIVSQPLDGGVAGNGVYTWGNKFPNQTIAYTNYFVDVVFKADAGKECSSGCTINVPVMAPNVMYASVMTSDDGVTWTTGAPTAVSFSAADGGTPPCTFSIVPSSHNYGAAGGLFAVDLTASAPDCGWTASSGAGWLTLDQNSGTGSASLQLIAAANSGSSRSTTVTIAGRSFSATQDAASVSPSTVRGASGMRQSGGRLQ